MRKRKEMDDLILEISNLTDKIESSKKKNRKERLHCNMRKIAALMKLGAVFTVIPLAGTMVSCAIGWNPFKLNDKKVSKSITTTVDREGNEIVEEEYNGEEDSYITLNYYTKWKETDNGNYTRDKYEYILVSNTDLSDLIGLIKSGESITRERIEELVNDHLKNYISSSKLYYSYNNEVKAIIDEDYENKDYIDISWSKADKSDYILEKESRGAHIAVFSLISMFEILGVVIETIIINGETYFFEHQKDKLHASPYLIDIELLQRELNAKQRLFTEYQYESLEEESDEKTVQEKTVQYKKLQRLQ